MMHYWQSGGGRSTSKLALKAFLLLLRECMCSRMVSVAYGVCSTFSASFHGDVSRHDRARVRVSSDTLRTPDRSLSPGRCASTALAVSPSSAPAIPKAGKRRFLDLTHCPQRLRRGCQRPIPGCVLGWEILPDFFSSNISSRGIQQHILSHTCLKQKTLEAQGDIQRRLV